MRTDVARNAPLTFFGSLILASTLSFAADTASAGTFQYDSFTVTNEQSIQVLSPSNLIGGIGQVILHGAGPDAGLVEAGWCVDAYDFLANSGVYTTGPLT